MKKFVWILVIFISLLIVFNRCTKVSVQPCNCCMTEDQVLDLINKNASTIPYSFEIIPSVKEYIIDDQSPILRDTSLRLFFRDTVFTTYDLY